jgi:hypothetical protein
MKLLSHYTDRRGLAGILSSGTLRATNFLDLNDTSEFFYAWNEINKASIRRYFELLPERIRNPKGDPDGIAANSLNKFRTHVRENKDVANIFVTSFARGAKPDHDARGLLTLWDRYTKHEGYCLQFALEDVQRMLELECKAANYVSAEMCTVDYGVNAENPKFKELVFQLSQRMLVDTLKSGQPINEGLEPERMWPEWRLLHDLTLFCARHKDPCYEDEREVRIFVSPAEKAESRMFSGIARRKEIQELPGGRRFLALGEFWHPQLMPRRILIGSKADPNIKSLLPEDRSWPEIAQANLPVA